MLRHFLLFGAAISLIAGCSTSSLDDGPREIDEGATFFIDEEETVVIRQTQQALTFEERISDSRCPNSEGVQCVWEGRVTFVLSLRERLQDRGGAFLEVEAFLGGEGEGAVTLDTLGMHWTFERLDPYPTIDPIAPTTPVRLTMQIESDR